MGINKLRHFQLVYELGSIRKAADILNMSSGSLSKSIKNLEDEIDGKLFLPDGRNIQSSNLAKNFYAKCKKLIIEYDETMNLAKNKSIEESQFRIGTWEVFSSYFLAKFAVREKINLLVLEKVPESLENALLNNEIDVGITYAPVPHQEIEYLRICKFRFAAFGLLSAFKDKQIGDVAFAVPVTAINNSPLGIKSLDHWPSHIPRRIKHKFELLETALETARYGEAVVYAPDFVIELQNIKLQKKYQLQKLPQLNQYSSKLQDIFIAKRKDQIEDKNIKKLAKALRVSMLP